MHLLPCDFWEVNQGRNIICLGQHWQLVTLPSLSSTGTLHDAACAHELGNKIPEVWAKESHKRVKAQWDIWRLNRYLWSWIIALNSRFDKHSVSDMYILWKEYVVVCNLVNLNWTERFYMPMLWCFHYRERHIYKKLGWGQQKAIKRKWY